MKNLKNSNKGFTMVELVVATAILTVIMVPLMRSFIIASNTTRQANIYGETSTAIKNVAELVTGASMSSINDLDGVEDMLSVFPAYDSTTGITVTRHEYDSLTSWADYDTWIPSGLTEASSSAFLENSKVFTIENANMGSGAGIMEVIITPISDSATLGALDYNEWYADVNSTNFSSFTNMDVTMLQPGVEVVSDGVNVSKTVNTSVHADYRAATYFSSEIATNSSLDRNVQITLKESTNSTALNPRLTYEVKYIYTLDIANTWDVTVFAGDAGYGDDDVCSIQIAYYPFYSGTTTTPFIATDRFTIVNDADLPVKLFLMKQDITGFPLPVTGETITSQHETNYKCSIYLKETTGTATNPTSRLYTNMNLNVSDATSLSEFNFKYYFNDVEAGDAFKDRLVADDTGGRAFNVHVNAYQRKLTGSGYDLIDQLTTVKLI